MHSNKWIIEWFISVINSIYSQNVDNKLFEVIIIDNGNNKEFSIEILKYEKKYSNLLLYKKIYAILFQNQNSCF